MRVWLSFFVIICIVAAVIYFVPNYKAQFLHLLTYNQCDTQLQYRLGNVDSRFGLSNNEILQDIQQATSIWNTVQGKTLFSYSPSAQLTVNFVYDERQALDTSINQLNDQLAQNDKSLTQQIADYEAKVAAFKQKLADFNATVDKYNQQGGAPQSVYNDLLKQQQELNAEGATLNQEAKQLNLATHNYNSNVSILNSDINQFNTVLAQKPEEGLYNGGNNTITIYFANSKVELIHTLAHEFGHALGMTHVADPKAIMYAYTTNALTPTQDDLNQLHYICRNQSAIIHTAQAFDIWFVTEIHTLIK